MLTALLADVAGIASVCDAQADEFGSTFTDGTFTRTDGNTDRGLTGIADGGVIDPALPLTYDLM
jgi:hypothetical protein